MTLTIGPLTCTPPVEPFKTTLVRQIDVIQATLNGHDSKFDAEMVNRRYNTTVSLIFIRSFQLLSYLERIRFLSGVFFCQRVVR